MQPRPIISSIRRVMDLLWPDKSKAVTDRKLQVFPIVELIPILSSVVTGRDWCITQHMLPQHRQKPLAIDAFPSSCLVRDCLAAGKRCYPGKIHPAFPHSLFSLSSSYFSEPSTPIGPREKKPTRHRVNLLPILCQLCNMSHPKINRLYLSFGYSRRHRLTNLQFPCLEDGRSEVMMPLTRGV